MGDRDRISISILDQYVPEHEAYLHPNLNRRPAREEIEEVKSLVGKYGLKNISDAERDFWE